MFSGNKPARWSANAGHRTVVLAIITLLLPLLFSAADHPSRASSGELKIMISGGFRTACQELVPEFERKTGYTIVTVSGPSMGSTPDAIPNRLHRNEPADVVIVASSSLEELIKQHKVIPETRVDLASSVIAMAVRAGAPKPDISSLEALKHTLLTAKSIAYSNSISGIYLSTELFPRLGIADVIRNKCLRVDTGMVGTVIARGDAEIGFQQLSELLPITGIDIVGPIPPEAQKVTVYSGGVVFNSKQPAMAKQFLEFLASPHAASAIQNSGMQQCLHGNNEQKDAVDKSVNCR